MRKTEKKTERRVRVTVELPVSFVRLLEMKAGICAWKEKVEGGKEHGLDVGEVLAWLIYLEARGAHEEEIHALTPMMWRQSGGPELIHSERKVIDD
jgi:hypothetical protein